MNIAFLSIFAPATGNATTANRICGYLEEQGIAVTKIDVEQITEQELQSIIEEQNIQILIGVNAYRAGRFMGDLCIPTVILFGGTDLNIQLKDPEKKNVMDTVIQKASVLVAMNQQLRSIAEQAWPNEVHKLQVITRGVHTCPSNFDLRSVVTVKEDDIVYLLPAGIRPVKGIDFLLDEAEKWHAENPRIHLVIAGAARDESYESSIQKRIEGCDGIHLLPPLALQDLHAVITQVEAVLNTSESEGMCNSILEAMTLGTPVLARDIAGNRAVVSHGSTGMLFGNPEEWRQCAEDLLEDRSKREQLIENAKSYIEKVHSYEEEGAKYRGIINTLR